MRTNPPPTMSPKPPSLNRGDRTGAGHAAIARRDVRASGVLDQEPRAADRTGLGAAVVRVRRGHRRQAWWRASRGGWDAGPRSSARVTRPGVVVGGPAPRREGRDV